MTGKNIIVVGLQSWDIEIGSNCKNIALELSTSNKVLYVNRALDMASLARRKKDSMVRNRQKGYFGNKSGLNEVSNTLWTFNPKTILFSVNWMPAGLFRIFNKINNKKIAVEILRAVKELDFKDYILFIDNDFFRAQYLAELIRPSGTIYYIRDYLVSQPYFQKHGPEAEKQLIAKSDLVVTNSGFLADYASRYNPRSFFIGQGCDFTAFDNIHDLAEPEDLKVVRSPIIGYVGALSAKRLDIDLITGIAKAFPELVVMLVGPEDDQFRTSVLHDLDNVIFTGPKLQLELPRYINTFEICINPQLVNELTEGNYPRKIDEYLVLGKPVVATRTVFMEYFRQHVYLCNNLEDYIDNISKILKQDVNEDEIEARIAFARSHSWENCVQIMSSRYDEFIEKSHIQ